MVKQLLDKQLFCSLIDKYDLPAPVSVTISSVEEIEKKIVKSFPFPAIIKPSFKQAWWSSSFYEELGDYQKAIKCNNFEDLIKTYQKIAKVNPHVVVQEYIKGDESQIYSVNMYVDSSGELKGYFIAQKLRTYPVRAGEGSYITTVKDPEMISMAMNIATKLKLTGLLNIQFKRDSRTGKPVLLEVHTRNSVWSYLGTVAGANLAATYYRDITDDADHEESKYKPGVKFIFIEKDLKAFLQNIKEQELPVFAWLRSYLTKFTPGGYKLTDPLPALMKLWFILKRRIIT
jgi:predicted ATP-grasp superfamily ATP-dependent carboligase